MSDWDRVAQCESGNRWDLPYGDNGKSTGGIQFQGPSWSDALAELRRQGIDTSNYPAVAYQATKNQQVLAGEALLAMQGPRAWSVTWNGGAHCGNAAGGALADGSVFEGGPNPFGEGADLQAIADGGAAQAPAPKPKPKPKPKPAPVTNTGVSKGKVHTVVSGDTLYDIAITYGVGDGGLDTWKPLYEANRREVGSNPHLIFPGQQIRIPGGEVEAPAPKPEPPKVTTQYAAPVDGMVTQSYRNPGNYSAGFHTGVDLSCSTGQAVRSAGPGTVVATGGEGAAYGNHVKVKHPDGRYTLYAHLNSVSVSNGQSVDGGTIVGACGSTGTSTGAHLHFEVRAGAGGYNDHVDPLAWLRSHGVSL